MSKLRRPGPDQARAAARAFGAPITVRQTGHGLINSSFAVHMQEQVIFLQWLNHHVFADVEAVQDNVACVLRHLHEQAPHTGAPRLLTTLAGADRLHDDYGLWRAMTWLPERITLHRPKASHHAKAAGQALGKMLRALARLAPEQIAPTLVGYHDLSVRLAELATARQGADAERLRQANALLEHCQEAAPRHIKRMLPSPPRVIHGDPKFTNFLLPGDASGSAVLVDYDTVMVAGLHIDFGDFMRSVASVGGEDDVQQAAVNMVMAQAAIDGFVRGVGHEALDAQTQAALVPAPACVAFMLGVRFLADYLCGDRYFLIRDAQQNLRRAETQVALAQSFEAQEDMLAEQITGALHRLA